MRAKQMEINSTVDSVKPLGSPVVCRKDPKGLMKSLIPCGGMGAKQVEINQLSIL
jgi:hypothetical protein